ncbi:properdin isoform X2 [Archocentrus centrarchus]|uniref:properdin isoform X2 n=1 Tax=Archocentrus centrarchus TaxID=63155 RepID=UPI0011EA2213|nr:properdin isoform X2 [Archocentrus centrarchus]
MIFFVCIFSLPAWSLWSSWSFCNVLCGEGVRQRSRKCFGIGKSECENAPFSDKLQTEPCTGTCCDDEGWGPWIAWTPCSVTCGGVGVRSRKRVCSSPPECRMACSGPSEETERCAAHSTCPVHGGWSSWFGWSHCSASCISKSGGDAIIPSRVRHRSCSNPSPSNNTLPPGNSCPGDAFQVQHCSELPNCAEDGNWGAWAPFGQCSVSCGVGLQLSLRMCDSPAPKYGGKLCDGPSTRSTICQSPCPVDGFWSGWSSWGECSESCISQGRAVRRTRQRSCSNPAPSSNPPGQDCQGHSHQTENCDHLPFCPVDGGWGSWSPFSSCPVTCGVGLQVSVRRCDSPAPQHGGRPCPGEGRQTRLCSTKVHCPVDGVWSEWSEWKQCKFPGGRNIRCKKTAGSHLRSRHCLHRAHNGTICIGDNLTEMQVCYDIEGCDLKGRRDPWTSWSLCEPPCGKNSIRSRKKICKPEYSGYNLYPPRATGKASFYGTPKVDCGPLADGEQLEQSQPCMNVPACT